MSEAVAACDALMSDGSSVFYDFWVTAKPFLYLRTSRSEKLHEHAFNLIKQYHYIADNFSKIEEFVEKVCSGQDDRMTRQKAVFAWQEIPSPKGIGKKIQRFVEASIREESGLEFNRIGRVAP